MNIKDFLEPIRDTWKQYKKPFLLGSAILIGILIFISVLSFVISSIDKATAVYVDITFNTNGGSILNPAKVRKGRKLEENMKTEKAGFEFVGWEYNGELFDTTTPIKENMLLHAKWEKTGATLTHIVNFETYGGTTIEPIEVSEGRTFTKPLNPSKNGYKFVGWYVGEEPYNFMKMAVSNDITLKAKWERINPINETGKEQDRSAALFEQLSGTWYLKEYEDVYFTITEEDNGFNQIWYFLKWYNIDLLNECELYRKGNYQRAISMEKAEFYQKLIGFHFYFKEESLIMKKDGKEYEFTKTQGFKNRYTDTIYEHAAGRWFLENSYSSYIDITSEKTNNVLDYDTYCIRTTNINLETLQLGSSMEYGCRKAYDESLFKDLKIEISSDVMTIKNDSGVKHFTLNRVAEIGSVTGVKVDKVGAVLETGRKLTLFATVMPREANNTKVIWETSDASVATVEGSPNIITTSADGVRYSATVTAKKSGVATITVRTVDGGHIATSKITVPEVAVNAISLNKKETTIYVGNFENLKAIVTPSNASNQRLSWSSSNPEVATVNENGNIRGLKEGKTTITVSTEDGTKKATCVVNVKYVSLNVVTAMSYTRKLLGGNYVNGINVTVTPSGGSGIYSSYQIKLYYNHNLVEESTTSELFYATELKGNYYAEIIVVDSEGHKSVTTKEYIKN
ncbi:MAG: hypothetical protein HFH08_05700 [Bacilli bacterium]|nr:hypothetical protein [Bacilli bacterium]